MANPARRPRLGTLLAVASGGALGALARVMLPWPVLLEPVDQLFDPLPIVLVNLLGATLLGLITGVATTKQWPEPLAKGISTGFFGAFTTMSSLAVIIIAWSFGQTAWSLDSPAHERLILLGIVLSLIALVAITIWLTSVMLRLGTRLGGGVTGT